ncbi:MAG: hypothetical protein GY909_09310 [Oligoflexia bacterium]|nr:hypothetical protein [Oligoflexia bacterium]
MGKSHKPLAILYIALLLGLGTIVPVSDNSASRGIASDSSNGCYHIIGKFAQESAKEFERYFTDSVIPAKYQTEIMEAFKELKISNTVIKETLQEVKTPPSSIEDIKRTKDYLLYVATLFPHQKKKALSFIDGLYDETWQSSKDFKKFRKVQKKFDDYYAKKLKKMPAEEALKETDKFKKLYRGCNTKGLTQEHAQGGKAFTAFTISIAALSSGAFYTYSNYDDPDFLTKEFFGKLTYEMVGDGLWAALASWIFKDPEGTFLGKSLKMYLSDNALIFADALTWEQLFSEGEADAKERLEKLKNDPEAQKDLERLIELLKREKFMDKFKAKFSDLLATMKLKDKEQQFDLDSITLEDLEDETVQQLLMEAALKDMYEDESGEMSLGTYGADRYAFYSMIGIPFMFLDTFVTTRIYQTMCMAPLNPKMAILKAAMIFTAYSIFYDTIVYPMRKTLIGE